MFNLKKTLSLVVLAGLLANTEAFARGDKGNQLQQPQGEEQQRNARAPQRQNPEAEPRREQPAPAPQRAVQLSQLAEEDQYINALTRIIMQHPPEERFGVLLLAILFNQNNDSDEE